jgi:NTP pyrophosphatase (non-canonical NTP hydrolase)
MENNRTQLGKTERLKTMSEQFIAAFNALQQEVHQTAREKGWWEMREKIEDLCATDGLRLEAEKLVDGQIIALIQSEASEWLEGLRHGNPPDDKVPEFSAAEAEAADIIIRIMDWAQKREMRVAEAVVEKAAMNKGRSIRHGGKAF